MTKTQRQRGGKKREARYGVLGFWGGELAATLQHQGGGGPAQACTNSETPNEVFYFSGNGE